MNLRLKNVIITGLSFTEHAMKGSVVKQMNEKLEHDINEGDIKYLVKLNQRGREGMSRVKVAFKDQGTKNKVYASKKKLKGNMDHRGPNTIKSQPVL